MSQPLKAPFPAFGGKSRAAAMTWARLSSPNSPAENFIEPFVYSAAMLLARPDWNPALHVETINDKNAFVANFWRAIQKDPEAVAEHADWPINETDLHARHRWLIESKSAIDSIARVKEYPDAFDPKVAGWWCWGLCCWIGNGWCEELSEKRPVITGQWSNGKGVNSGPHQKRPQISEHTGKGTLNGRHKMGQGRPQLADAYARGRGVNANDAITAVGRRREWLTKWMVRLSDRLRPVRVLCGDWDRVCGSPSVLTRLGTTAVFLDPPYCYDQARMMRWFIYLTGSGPAPEPTAKGSNRAANLYVNDKDQDVDRLCAEVALWCVKWGDNPKMRIAVCGLEGEYDALEPLGWEKVAWKSRGGYGNRNKGNDNNARERIWFSPNTLKFSMDQLTDPAEIFG
jgi:DNA adenine methylase